MPSLHTLSAIGTLDNVDADDENDVREPCILPICFNTRHLALSQPEVDLSVLVKLLGSFPILESIQYANYTLDGDFLGPDQIFNAISHLKPTLESLTLIAVEWERWETTWKETQPESSAGALVDFKKLKRITLSLSLLLRRSKTEHDFSDLDEIPSNYL